MVSSSYGYIMNKWWAARQTTGTLIQTLNTLQEDIKNTETSSCKEFEKIAQNAETLHTALVKALNAIKA